MAERYFFTQSQWDRNCLVVLEGTDKCYFPGQVGHVFCSAVFDVHLNTLSIAQVASRRLWNETCRRLINKFMGIHISEEFTKRTPLFKALLEQKKLSSNRQKLRGTQNPSTKGTLLSTRQLFPEHE